jgi:replicative DNA helicase
MSLQWVLAAAEANPKLTVAYVCVEITSPRLLNRLISHAGQVDYRRVRKRELTPADEPKVQAALTRLDAVADRLHLLTDGPFTLDAILGRVNEITPTPGLIALDYVQRLSMPAEIGRRPDPRESVSSLMTECRHLAAQGAGVLVLSAANRAGGGYNRLKITSGRETSELEFAADAVWAIQTGAEVPDGGGRVLEVLKARDGELAEVRVEFDGRHQTFRVLAPSSPDPAGVPDWVRDLERGGPKG